LEPFRRLTIQPPLPAPYQNTDKACEFSTDIAEFRLPAAGFNVWAGLRV
jgi:hypothetical protein